MDEVSPEVSAAVLSEDGATPEHDDGQEEPPPSEPSQGQLAILCVEVCVDGNAEGFFSKKHDVVFTVEATKESACFVVSQDDSGLTRSSETLTLCPIQKMTEDSHILVSLRDDEGRDEHEQPEKESFGRVEAKTILAALDSGESISVVIGETEHGEESIEEELPGDTRVRVSFEVKKVDSDVELLGRPPKTPKKKKKRAKSKSKSPVRASGKSKSPVRAGSKPKPGKSQVKKKLPAKRDGSPVKRKGSPGRKKKSSKKPGTDGENEDNAENGKPKEDCADEGNDENEVKGEQEADHAGGENKDEAGPVSEGEHEDEEKVVSNDANDEDPPEDTAEGKAEDGAANTGAASEGQEHKSAEDEEIARKQAEIDAIMAELDSTPIKPRPPKARSGKPKGDFRPLAGAKYVTAIEKMEKRRLAESEEGGNNQDDSKSNEEKSVGWASGGEQEYLWKGSLSARGPVHKLRKASVYSSGRPRGRRGGQRRTAPAEAFRLPPLKSKEFMRARENMWDGSSHVNDQRIVHYESIKDPLCHGGFVTSRRQEVLNHIIETEMIMQERSLTEQTFFKILKNGEVSTLSDFHFRNEARGAAAEAENQSEFSGSIDANLQKLGELVPHEEYFDRLTAKYDTTEMVAKAAKTMLLDIKEHASSTEAKKVFAMTPGERLLWSSYPDLKERPPRRHILHNRGIFTGKNNTYKEKGH